MIPCQQKYRLVPAGEGEFHIEKKILFYWSPLTIEDIHIGHGATIYGLLKFRKEHAEKLVRVLRWVNYNNNVLNWKFLRKLKRKFNVEYSYNSI